MVVKFWVAVPLMTREVLTLYRRKLAPGGIIAFHISNLYLQLAPTLGALAQNAGLVCLMEDESAVSKAEMDAGKLPSKWLVMAQSNSDLGTLTTNARWTPVNTPAETQIWTDDYSNLLRVIKWN